MAPKEIKVFTQEETIQMQLVETHNHQVNAAERVTKKFKNHFIAGLSIGDKNFPTTLWSYLIIQAKDSLNLLRASRFHP